MSEQNKSWHEHAHWPYSLRRGSVKIAIFRNVTKEGRIWYNARKSNVYKKGDDFVDGDSYLESELLTDAKLSEAAWGKIGEFKALDRQEGEAVDRESDPEPPAAANANW